MTFQFLGTGTSVGVPQIGCNCPVCTSTDPRDKRRRCGAYVTSENAAFLIDTPPELRLACIEYGISRVDAVCLTHSHMDHVAAFDDLRRFNTINGQKIPVSKGDPLYRGLPYRFVGKIMPCYALPETIDAMHQIFPYISGNAGGNGLFRPQIQFINNLQPFSIGDISIETIRVEHGFPCCGYILNNSLAYISDCHDLSNEIIAKLHKIPTLILNCLRVREHPTHLSLPRALSYIEKISPTRTFLTHLCHDLLHAEWLKTLPPSVSPAYDGLTLSF